MLLVANTKRISICRTAFDDYKTVPPGGKHILFVTKVSLSKDTEQTAEHTDLC